LPFHLSSLSFASVKKPVQRQPTPATRRDNRFLLQLLVPQSNELARVIAVGWRRTALALAPAAREQLALAFTQLRATHDGTSRSNEDWRIGRVVRARGLGQTLNDWVNKAEVDAGKRPGASTDMTARMKALERENRELRQANEILRKASAYFAVAELDRRSKMRPVAAGGARRSRWCGDWRIIHLNKGC
jgi:transposase